MWLLKPQIQIIQNGLIHTSQQLTIRSIRCIHGASLCCTPCSTEAPLTPTHYFPPAALERFKPRYIMCKWPGPYPNASLQHVRWARSLWIFLCFVLSEPSFFLPGLEKQSFFFSFSKRPLFLFYFFCTITVSTPQGASLENAMSMKDGNGADVRWKAGKQKELTVWRSGLKTLPLIHSWTDHYCFTKCFFFFLQNQSSGGALAYFNVCSEYIDLANENDL